MRGYFLFVIKHFLFKLPETFLLNLERAIYHIQESLVLVVLLFIKHILISRISFYETFLSHFALFLKLKWLKIVMHNHGIEKLIFRRGKIKQFPKIAFFYGKGYGFIFFYCEYIH